VRYLNRADRADTYAFICAPRPSARRARERRFMRGVAAANVDLRRPAGLWAYRIGQFSILLMVTFSDSRQSRCRVASSNRFGFRPEPDDADLSAPLLTTTRDSRAGSPIVPTSEQTPILGQAVGAVLLARRVVRSGLVDVLSESTSAVRSNGLVVNCRYPVMLADDSCSLRTAPPTSATGSSVRVRCRTGSPNSPMQRGEHAFECRMRRGVQFRTVSGFGVRLCGAIAVQAVRSTWF
jgi:hypothetical protein